jgi:hypothetical protein
MDQNDSFYVAFTNMEKDYLLKISKFINEISCTHILMAKAVYKHANNGLLKTPSSKSA